MGGGGAAVREYVGQQCPGLDLEGGVSDFGPIFDVGDALFEDRRDIIVQPALAFVRAFGALLDPEAAIGGRRAAAGTAWGAAGAASVPAAVTAAADNNTLRNSYVKGGFAAWQWGCNAGISPNYSKCRGCGRGVNAAGS